VIQCFLVWNSVVAVVKHAKVETFQWKQETKPTGRQKQVSKFNRAAKNRLAAIGISSPSRTTRPNVVAALDCSIIKRTEKASKADWKPFSSAYNLEYDPQGRFVVATKRTRFPVCEH